MTDDIEQLTGALEEMRIADLARRPPIRELLVLAAEVESALRPGGLDSATRARLFARTLALADAHLHRSWTDRVPGGRRSVIGGALGGAVVVTVAAIGIAVARERRHHAAAA